MKIPRRWIGVGSFAAGMALGAVSLIVESGLLGAAALFLVLIGHALILNYAYGRSDS